MTSKEKLCMIYLYHNNEIKNNTNGKGEISNSVKQYYKDIEKDLEILEILKKKTTLLPNGEITINCKDISYEETIKIKEWLNNDK